MKRWLAEEGQEGGLRIPSAAEVDDAVYLATKALERLHDISERATRDVLAQAFTKLVFAGTEQIHANYGHDLQLAIGLRTTEHFAVIFMTQGATELGRKVYGECTTSKCTLYPRQVFGDAFALGATQIIIAHNHPGGVCLPSPADRALTKRMQDMGESLEVSLLDHVIVTATDHYSMRSAGLL